MSRVQQVNRLLFKPSGTRSCQFSGIATLGKVTHRTGTTLTDAKYAMVKRVGGVTRDGVTISVQPVNMGNGTGDIKKSGNWRYPGGVIKRHASRVINDKEYFDPKDPSENRRKIESNFLITLNTNKSMNDVPPGQAHQARMAAKDTLHMLALDESICKFMKFGPVSEEYREDRYADIIEKVEWQSSVECGEKYNRLHVHIWLTVHHYSQVQVNMPVIQQMFKQSYNAQVPENLRVRRNPYVNVKLLPTSDWAMVIKQYIHKGMQEHMAQDVV